VLPSFQVISYLLPNKVMVWYGYGSMVGATFFLFLQIILLVDFAYDWNEKWVNKEWYKAIIAVAAVIYIASFTGMVLIYVWFAHSTSCGLNIFLITFITILSIVATYLSLRDDLHRGSLLSSAVITGACIYFTFSALLNTTNSCNPFPPTATAHVWMLGIGIVLAIASICWNTIASASASGVFKITADKEPLLKHEDDCYNFSYFHLVFACGAMYMAMLFTGWNLSSVIAEGQFAIDPVSMWAKIGSSWLTILFYIWSMIGPLLFPNREWN